MQKELVSGTAFHERQFSRRSFAAGALVLAALVSGSLAMAGDGDEHWVTTWGTSLHPGDLGVPGLSNTGFNNQTLRQVVHTSVGGHHVRVRLSAFGANAVVIGSAHVAVHASGAAIMPASDRTLTFGGKP